MKPINDVTPIQVSGPVDNIVDEEEAKCTFFVIDVAVP
jgi:hypothetical protein